MWVQPSMPPSRSRSALRNRGDRQARQPLEIRVDLGASGVGRARHRRRHRVDVTAAVDRQPQLHVVQRRPRRAVAAEVAVVVEGRVSMKRPSMSIMPSSRRKLRQTMLRVWIASRAAGAAGSSRCRDRRAGFRRALPSMASG